MPPPDGEIPGNESPVATPGGSTAAIGAQSPANTALTLEAIQAALRAETAPLRAELASLRNAQEAAKRIAKSKGPAAATPVTDGAAVNPNAPNLDIIPDDNPLKPWAKRAQETLEAIARREADAAAEAERNRAANALNALIDEHKPARAQKLRAMGTPYLKVGSDGKVYHDDGAVMRPVEEWFREQLADDIFKPASVSQGSGTTPGAAPVIGRPNVMAATAPIADPLDRLARQLELQAANK